MAYQSITLEIKEKVAWLTLNTPPTNIIDIPMTTELVDALEGLKKEPGVKIVVLRGAGEHAFSTGVSVEDHLEDKVDQMIPLFGRTLRAILSLDIPVLSVVRGYCLGGGAELACVCDLVIAAESAKLGQPEIRFGDYAPLAIAAYTKFLGTRRTMDLLLTADTFSAREAQQMGLVSRVFPDSELDAEVEKMVKRISGMSLVALKANKRAILACQDLSFSAALDLSEYIYLNILAKSADGMEGLRAFLEKRKPVWQDR